MYNAMKTLINKKFYKTTDIAQNKLDVVYAANRLTDDEYLELTTLIQTIYMEKETFVI